jgi:hypothetical protein
MIHHKNQKSSNEFIKTIFFPFHSKFANQDNFVDVFLTFLVHTHGVSRFILIKSLFANEHFIHKFSVRSIIIVMKRKKQRNKRGYDFEGVANRKATKFIQIKLLLGLKIASFKLSLSIESPDTKFALA